MATVAVATPPPVLPTTVRRQAPASKLSLTPGASTSGLRATSIDGSSLVSQSATQGTVGITYGEPSAIQPTAITNGGTLQSSAVINGDSIGDQPISNGTAGLTYGEQTDESSSYQATLGLSGDGLALHATYEDSVDPKSYVNPSLGSTQAVPVQTVPATTASGQTAAIQVALGGNPGADSNSYANSSLGSTQAVPVQTVPATATSGQNAPIQVALGGNPGLDSNSYVDAPLRSVQTNPNQTIPVTTGSGSTAPIQVTLGSNSGDLAAQGSAQGTLGSKEVYGTPVQYPPYFVNDVAIVQSALAKTFKDLWREIRPPTNLAPLLVRLDAEDYNRSARNFNATIPKVNDPLAHMVHYLHGTHIPDFPETLKVLEGLATSNIVHAINLLTSLGIFNIRLTTDEVSSLHAHDENWQTKHESPINLTHLTHKDDKSTLTEQLRVAIGLPALPVDVAQITAALASMIRL